MTGTDAAAEPQAGWVDDDVHAEFPDLRLWSLRVAGAAGRSPAGLRQRLRLMSDRFHGARAIQLRTDPIPHAYRVFYRHIGLDPDEDRVPVEAAVLDRLVKGGFQSRGLPDDALSIAIVETGVPLWALDDAKLDGPLGIRSARRGEGHGGRLVVADASGPVCELFAEPGPDRAAAPDSAAMRLFTVQVAGVPAIHVEEALWTCAEALDTSG